MENRQTILVVEDEIVNRSILRRLLEDNYNILEAEDGAEAWKIICDKREEISAVLLDIALPVMDGFAVLDKMAENHMEDIPVIVTTGITDVDTEHKALEAGAWDFVSKPYNSKILCSRLRSAVARRQISTYEKKQYFSEHDELTGFYNRNKMFEESKKLLAAYPQENFAFIRLDIDHFALYNTSFGEQEGNRLLEYFANCIREIAESYPMCVYGRMNADVFCACFPYSGDEDNVNKQVEYIQKKLADYRQDYRLELSVGICRIDDQQLSMDDFYFRASMAAQKCKNIYAMHYAFYDEAAGNEIAMELAITNEMQTALNQKQFVVFLQPKIDLKTDLVCGAEALVRWMHPVKGMVSPGDFIPVFERNGFISKLDYYVWEETCRMLQEWILAGRKPFPISVNISRISLYNPQLVELMTELVERYNVPTTLFQLEITESAYMTNPQLMERTIEKLHHAGFTILMDDFGSGYSSLNTLKSIKVDILKVDMKFLPVEDETERGEIILTSVIKMAKWLGMEIVVEGVETRFQRNFLEGIGCDCVQGYYYSKPISRADYEEKYMNHRLENTGEELQKTTEEPERERTILVIDDDETDRVILRENLKGLYHMKECESVEEGLAYLRRSMNKVQLILIDNLMQGMSGLQFLKYCQQDSALKAIPKIMITASDTPEDQVAAFNEGAYDYITKPFAKEIVVARVKHVMETYGKTSVYTLVEQGYAQKSELDFSTKLFNKIAFQEIGLHMMELLPNELVAMLVLDIDEFRTINERYGYEVGNKVIQCIAEEFENVFSRSDVVGRLGGDKFIVLMTKLPNQEQGKYKADEISKAIEFRCAKELHIAINASIGLVFTKYDNFPTLYHKAEQALIEARKVGKGKTFIYGEAVPPVLNDNKPVILICSRDIQSYKAIALAYGDTAAFAMIMNYQELLEMFEKYRERICAICLDIQNKEDTDECYQYILQQDLDRKISIVAVCHDGDMNKLREVLEMDICDVLELPPQRDAIQQKISRLIIQGKTKK